VVVTHGGVINAYFSHILGIEGQDMFFLPENTSLNTVVIRAEERLAWFLSDASHLTDPGWFLLRDWERDLAEDG
jgi:broad specificity phosphatase PhoE